MRDFQPEAQVLRGSGKGNPVGLGHQQVVESLVIGVFPLQGLITHYNAL